MCGMTQATLQMFDAPLPLAGEKLAPYQPEAQTLIGSLQGGQGMKEILLNRGFVALVDDEDYEKLCHFNWTVSDLKNNKTQYAFCNKYHGKKMLMHQVVMIPPPDGQTIDHKDRNGLNNQKSNLRYATPSQQQLNRGKIKGTKTRYKGVFYRASGRKRWQARISVNKKKISLGGYYTEEEAARAYDAYIKVHCLDFGVPNFP
jgi:hypothetical protein